MAPFGPRPVPEAVQVALQELDGLVVDVEPAHVRTRSRDRYWTSPILRDRLQSIVGDAIVAPTSMLELKRVAAACFRHNVPLTVRGGGMGTSGQAMPLRGGLVVDTGYLNRVIHVEAGWCRAEAGCSVGTLDRTVHEQGQALRLHPASCEVATVGGFVADGSAGVGSIAWGTLQDTGAVRALRVMTIEERPRLLELRGAHVRVALRSLGTTGIITEVELPTAPAARWMERVVGFADFEQAIRFADALAHEDAISKRLVSVVAAPGPGRFLFHHGVDNAAHVVLAMLAATAQEAFETVLNEYGGEILGVGSSPLFETSWEGTLAKAVNHDRRWTHLQSAFPAGDHVATALHLRDALDPEEVILHLEFLRARGRITCVGLPLVRFTTPERLEAIMTLHATAGSTVVNPHALTLEEMVGKPVDPRVVTFKREVDPRDLLNPGKLAKAAPEGS